MLVILIVVNLSFADSLMVIGYHGPTEARTTISGDHRFLGASIVTLLVNLADVPHNKSWRREAGLLASWSTGVSFGPWLLPCPCALLRDCIQYGVCLEWVARDAALAFELDGGIVCVVFESKGSPKEKPPEWTKARDERLCSGG